MIQGVFVDDTPFVKMIVGWGQAVQTPFFVLDTGFTGDLQVTPEIARELGLKITGVTPARLANGRVENVPTALALAAMENMTHYVEILISKGMPLSGISLFSKFGYRIIVDCKYRKISLRRMP